MGNRENRSTEVALSTLTEVVRAYGGIASLLQLDITAAFDSVDQRIHYRETGLPPLRKPNDRSNTAGVSHILSRRLYTVIIKSFPVRLSDKQDTTEITKRMSASNGLTELVASVTLPRVHRGIVRFGVEYLRLVDYAITSQFARKPRASAKFAPLIIAVDGVEAANKLCRDGIVYQSEIFDAEPYNTAVNPRQCYRCHKFGQAVGGRHSLRHLGSVLFVR
ncbi:hypothetical protein E4U28_008292 [Claviceps purpurea]|nr:hypothetical protein E4U28_008292 [Claviceps purpurea]